MAVVPMQRIDICALKQDRKQILQALQRMGVIEVCDVMEEDSVFHRVDVTDASSQLKTNIRLAEQAIEVLDEYAPHEKGLFAGFQGKAEATAKEYDSFTNKTFSANKVAKLLVNQSKSILESKAEIQKLNTQIEALEPWMSLDVPLNFQGTKSTVAVIGILPGIWKEEQFYSEFASFVPFEVEIISQLREQTCFCLIALRALGEELSEALRMKGFARPVMQTKLPPSEQTKQYCSEISRLETEIQKCTSEIIKLDDKRDMIEFYRDYEAVREEKYEVIDRLIQSEHTFFLNGYVPERVADKVCVYLQEKFDVDIQLTTPDDHSDVPVLLSNVGFAEPMEGTIESFSLPGKGEMDPTCITAIFFYVLFGLMFGDAVYGLLMVVLIGIILLKFPKMEKGTKNFLKMFFFCGISTAFWGVMFGSYCGDAVDIISSTFFGHKVTIPPVLFLPMEKPMTLLILSICIGMVHLFFGLLMKFIQCVKQKKILDGIFDSIFWMVLVASLIVLLLTTEMLLGVVGMSKPLPKTAGTVAAITAGISAVGILLTAGRESKAVGKRLMKGAYGLYGVSGYINDIMSYSRLLALGLATGVMGSVFNLLAGMFGTGIIKVIVFIIIFIIGHVLNFGINILGAYVHTTRLQYVEFFGKFYEGGGRAFQPFLAKTKYYEIKEK